MQNPPVFVNQIRDEIVHLFAKILVPVIFLVALSNLATSLFTEIDYARVYVELMVLISLVVTLILYKLNYKMISMYMGTGLIAGTLVYAVIQNGGILAPAYIALLISIVFMYSIMPLWGTITYYIGFIILGIYSVYGGASWDRALLPSDQYYLIMYTSYGAILVASQVVISKTLKRLLDENIERSSKLSSAINAINEPIYILNHKGQLIESNQAGSTFQSEIEAYFNTSFFEVTWDQKHDEAITLHHLIQSKLLSDQSRINVDERFELELCLRLYQGYRWYELSLKPYQRQEGQGSILHIQDVTAQRKFMQVQKMDAVGQMASGIAHEYNNVLSAIMGSVDLLQFDPREDQIELLEYIDESTQRASALTKQLLMFTRKRPQFSKVVDLHDIIDSAFTLLRGTLDKKVKYLVVRSLEATIVQGDERLLTSAIMNLIINAAQAMPDGGLITVKTALLHSLSEKSKEDWHGTPLRSIPYVSFEVNDHGMGISSQVIEHIFEPFFSTRNRSAGVGVGLTAVYGAVSKHHGAIRVQSVEGEGSCFQVILPLSEIPVDQNKSLVPPASLSLPKGLKVLVVDDEAMLQQTLSRFLTHAGCEVTLASNGLEGVQAFQEDRFDVVILDMQMPILSGLEALKLMREHRGHVPVIIHSGYAKDEELEQLAVYGVSQVLSKPSRHQDLLKTIAYVLAETSS